MGELVEDVEDCLRGAGGARLGDVALLLARQSSLLRRGTDSWPANFVLMQLAADGECGPALAERAAELLQEGEHRRLWLRRAWRRAPDGIVCSIDAGPSLTGVAPLSDDRIATLGSSGHAAVWSLLTGMRLWSDQIGGQAGSPEGDPPVVHRVTKRHSTQDFEVRLESAWTVAVTSTSIVLHRPPAVWRLVLTPDEGEPRLEFDLGTSPIAALDVLGPRRWAICREGGVVQIWDLDRALAASGEPAAELARARVADIHPLPGGLLVSSEPAGHHDGHLSYWNRKTGAFVSKVLAHQLSLGAETVGRVTGCSPIGGMVLSWGWGAETKLWHPLASKPVRTLQIQSQVDVVAAVPFWYAPNTVSGEPATTRGRQPGERLLIVALTSRGVTALYDATRNVNKFLHQGRRTGFGDRDYARRHEMFSLDVLPPDRLVRRFRDENPLIYEIGLSLDNPEDTNPLMLGEPPKPMMQIAPQPVRFLGEEDRPEPVPFEVPRFANQNSEAQAGALTLLSTGQFALPRGPQIEIYGPDGHLVITLPGRSLIELPGKDLFLFGKDSEAGGPTGCGELRRLNELDVARAFDAVASKAIGASPMGDDLLTWHEDERFRLWNVPGARVIDSCRVGDAWHRRRDWVVARSRTEGRGHSVSGEWRTWTSSSVVGISGPAPGSGRVPLATVWHGHAPSRVVALEPDGSILVVQDHVEAVCLQVWWGGQPVDLEQAVEPARPAGSIGTARLAEVDQLLRRADLMGQLFLSPEQLALRQNDLDRAAALLEGRLDGELGSLWRWVLGDRVITLICAGLLDDARAVLGAGIDVEKDLTAETVESQRLVCMETILAVFENPERDLKLRLARLEANVPWPLTKVVSVILDLSPSLGGRFLNEERLLQGVVLEIVGLWGMSRAPFPLPPVQLAAFLVGTASTFIQAKRERSLVGILRLLDGDIGATEPDHPLRSQIADVLGTIPVAAPPRAATPRPPPPLADADPERAAALNIEYVRALAAWKALPLWKRLRTPKPTPPTGI